MGLPDDMRFGARGAKEAPSSLDWNDRCAKTKTPTSPAYKGKTSANSRRLCSPFQMRGAWSFPTKPFASVQARPQRHGLPFGPSDSENDYSFVTFRRTRATITPRRASGSPRFTTIINSIAHQEQLSTRFSDWSMRAFTVKCENMIEMRIWKTIGG